MTLTDEQIAYFRKEAKSLYSSTEIEIDEYPKVSTEADAGGAWVSAWVWVEEPEEEEESE